MPSKIKKTAVISAISKSGIPYSHTKNNGYFKKEDVVKFIEGLKKQNRLKRIALYWDNASIHTSEIVKDYC